MSDEGRATGPAPRRFNRRAVLAAAAGGVLAVGGGAVIADQDVLDRPLPRLLEPGHAGRLQVRRRAAGRMTG